MRGGNFRLLRQYFRRRGDLGESEEGWRYETEELVLFTAIMQLLTGSQDPSATLGMTVRGGPAYGRQTDRSDRRWRSK